jgi:integrase
VFFSTTESDTTSAAAIQFGWCDRVPKEEDPCSTDIQKLLPALPFRERTLVLLDVGTGLRMSELLALKWRDVNFRAREISVTRSIVFQVVGPCKTEASKKPIPLDSYLAKALRAWRKHTKYRRPDDWIFASPLAAVDGRTGRSPSCVT